MNKKNIIIYILISVPAAFLIYQIYVGETKRIADLKEKQELQQSTIANKANTEQIHTESNISNAIIPDTPISNSENQNVCLEEKFIIKDNLDEIQKRVKDVQESYSDFGQDEISWGRYIREWNIETQNLRKLKENQLFSCSNSLNYKATYTNLVLLGVSYAFNANKDIKIYEKMIRDNISSALVEINYTKKDQLAKNEGNKTKKINLKYSIVNVDYDAYKCVANVRIKEKISEDLLSELAIKIKNKVRKQYNRIHIFFFLPQMEVDNGAWARADFNPSLDISYFGQKPSDEQQVNQNIDNVKDYIGLWYDNAMQGDIVTRIRKDKSLGFVMELISTADTQPSKSPSILKVSKKNGKIIFIDIDSGYGEYYILETNKDLKVYDNQGYIATYRMLKFKGL